MSTAQQPPITEPRSPLEERADGQMPRPRRSPERRERDAWFMLLMLLLGTVTVFVLSTVNGSLQGQVSRPTTTRRTSIPAAQATVAPTSQQPGATAANATVVQAQGQNYLLPALNAGLMQPAVDAQGAVWVGEMDTNKLARFDPATRSVATWTPPNGKYNIMKTVVDRQGMVWYSEQAANSIGRFDPATQRFQVYQLASVNGQNAIPQDLALDASGNIWFTEISGQIGRIDPTNSTLQTWPIPSATPGVPSSPYCLTVAADGAVWFGYLQGGAVGRLDPATGHVTVTHLRDPQTEVFAMTADGHGSVWFTELDEPRIGRIVTASASVTELDVPAVLGDTTNLYGIAAAHDGSIWFASAGANALIRYQPTSATYEFYQLAVAQSIPYGIAFDGHGRLWFSADGSPANYLGMVQP